LSDALSILCIALIFAGLFFVLTGTIGVLKFKDLYTRMHAISKGTTFGFMFVLIGCAGLMGTPMDMGKALLAILFQFLTAPIASHMVGRVAMKKGIRPISSPDDEAPGVPASTVIRAPGAE